MSKNENVNKEILLWAFIHGAISSFLSPDIDIAQLLEDIDPEVLDEFFSGFGENEQKKKEMERKNGSR